VHSGLWETVADTLFWLQLCWIFSGFVLMAYLAFKVFPGKQEADPDPNRGSESQRENLPRTLSHPTRDRRVMNEEISKPRIVGDYRLEAFPQAPVARAKVIEFELLVSKQNRRWS